MNKLLNKSRIISFSILITILFCGCQPIPDNFPETKEIENATRAVAEVEYLDLNQTIERSDCAMVGEYIGAGESDSYVEYQFHVKEILYGQIPDMDIYLFCQKADVHVADTSYQFASDDPIYTVGEDYVLILDRFQSLFNAHDRYMLISDVFLPVSDPDSWRICDTSLYNIITEGESLTSFIVSCKSSFPETADDGDDFVRYTTSTDMDDILSVTDYIIKATVDSLLAEGIDAPCATYYCTPIEMMRGNQVIVNEEGKIGVIVPLDSVTIGETYYFLVNHVDELSILYKVTSYNSILPEDTDLLPLTD